MLLKDLLEKINLELSEKYDENKIINKSDMYDICKRMFPSGDKELKGKYIFWAGISFIVHMKKAKTKNFWGQEQRTYYSINIDDKYKENLNLDIEDILSKYESFKDKANSFLEKRKKAFLTNLEVHSLDLEDFRDLLEEYEQIRGWEL